MNFTLQDLATFAIGLVVALSFEVGSALIQADDAFADFNVWANGVAIALLTATGRYLLTYLTQRGLTSKT